MLAKSLNTNNEEEGDEHLTDDLCDMIEAYEKEVSEASRNNHNATKKRKSRTYEYVPGNGITRNDGRRYVPLSFKRPKFCNQSDDKKALEMEALACSERMANSILCSMENPKKVAKKKKIGDAEKPKFTSVNIDIANIDKHVQVNTKSYVTIETNEFDTISVLTLRTLAVKCPITSTPRKSNLAKNRLAAKIAPAFSFGDAFEDSNHGTRTQIPTPAKLVEKLKTTKTTIPKTVVSFAKPKSPDVIARERVQRVVKASGKDVEEVRSYFGSVEAERKLNSSLAVAENAQNRSWNASRSRYFITSSNFAVVTGVSTYSTSMNFFRERYLGQKPKSERLIQILTQGRENEEVGLEDFRRRWASGVGKKVEANEIPFDMNIPATDGSDLLCGTTPDGFCKSHVDPTEIYNVEIKCPINKVYDGLYENPPIVPIHHYIQVLSQTKQLNATHGYYSVYHAYSKTSAAVKVPFNAEAWAVVEEWIAKFHAVCVRFEKTWTRLSPDTILSREEFAKRKDASYLVEKFVKENSGYFRAKKKELSDQFVNFQKTTKNVLLYK